MNDQIIAKILTDIKTKDIPGEIKVILSDYVTLEKNEEHLRTIMEIVAEYSHLLGSMDEDLQSNLKQILFHANKEENQALLQVKKSLNSLKNDVRTVQDQKEIKSIMDVIQKIN